MNVITPSLDDYAARINEAHSLAVTHAATAIEKALEVGRLLTEAKDACSHGQWLPWLRENCAFSERTAQAYMRLHAKRDRIEVESAANAQRVADFSVRDALKYLAEPLGSDDGERKPPAMDRVDLALEGVGVVLDEFGHGDLWNRLGRERDDADVDDSEALNIADAGMLALAIKVSEEYFVLSPTILHGGIRTCGEHTRAGRSFKRIAAKFDALSALAGMQSL